MPQNRFLVFRPIFFDPGFLETRCLKMIKVASALEVQALELRSSSDSLLDDVQHVLSRGDP